MLARTQSGDETIQAVISRIGDPYRIASLDCQPVVCLRNRIRANATTAQLHASVSGSARSLRPPVRSGSAEARRIWRSATRHRIRVQISFYRQWRASTVSLDCLTLDTPLSVERGRPPGSEIRWATAYESRDSLSCKTLEHAIPHVAGFLLRPLRRGVERGLQPGRQDAGLGQWGQDASSCGTWRRGQRLGEPLTGHTGCGVERGLQPGRQDPGLGQ